MQVIDDSTQKDLKDKYEIYEIDNFRITVFHFNSQIKKAKFYHKHLDYEFVVLLTTLKGILFEGNKYIGEADTIYPISPNRMHGIETQVDSSEVSYIDITINNDYFNEILEEMGYAKNIEFNYEFPFNRLLATYILRYIKVYKSAKTLIKNEVLNSLRELICKELICLGLTRKNDNRRHELEIKEKFSSIANYIATNYNNPNIVEHVANLHCYTPGSLAKLFAKYYKIPIHQFILKVRLSNAKMLLKYTDLPIDDIAKECGFTGTKYFSEVFTKKNNISPRKYRKDYKGISEVEKSKSKKSIKNVINCNLIIYNEICYDEPEILYDDKKYSYFLIPLSLIKINEVVIMPKNLYYFEANEKLKIENIKNSTFYVLAIKKDIFNKFIKDYYLNLSDVSVMSNSFFAYIQDIINTYKNNEYITNTLVDLIIKEILYSYLETADLFYEELRQIINENINNDDIVKLICEKKGYTEKEFNKKFLKKFKVTPHKFLIHCRLLKAKEYLVNTNLKTDEIAFKSGFVSLNSFIFHMKEQNSVTPTQYRKEFRKTGKN